MVSVFAVANLLVALVFILYMVSMLAYHTSNMNFLLHLQLFGGFIIGLTSLPLWIQWMKYLSIFRYAIEVDHPCVHVNADAAVIVLLINVTLTNTSIDTNFFLCA